MQYSIAHYLIRASLTRKLQLPSLILASLLSASPSLAATQVRGATIAGESSPVLMANIFRRIRETVQDVTDTINTIDSSFPRSNRGDRSNPSPQAQPAPQPQSAPPSARPAPAASPASRPAQATNDVQILHRDNSPRLCRTSDGNCDAFDLIRRVLPSGDAVLIFSYYFNGTPVSFIARDEPDGQRDSVKGYTAQLFDDNPSSEVWAFCEVGSMGSNPYGLVGCSIRNGPRFVYLNGQ
ncbi:hypothetical protein P7L53_17945 [Thermoleptolyngbya sichuanensis XZ-Cy5]|uniref:hypothetical protein n=1 Tax=Thermoleptolyngbya sichuanensis TaxID=2885951 RepID=UPI00240E0B75|nr:hypothetical protein [Thermoleptolyngbya sichuanensis]MDG2618127.1 hypothetical protein [Thermoleptolyngbya sichuanensis XZ-Cy5]